MLTSGEGVNAFLKKVGLYLILNDSYLIQQPVLGRVAKSVTCLTETACLTADQGVARTVPTWSNTFVETDNETITLSFSSLPLIEEGLLPVTSESMCTKY